MKVLKISNKYGQYENDKGERFNLILCTWVKGERAKDFEDFDTFEDVLKEYGLTEVKDENKGL